MKASLFPLPNLDYSRVEVAPERDMAHEGRAPALPKLIVAGGGLQQGRIGARRTWIHSPASSISEKKILP